MPSVADCQVGASSISAMEMLNAVRQLFLQAADDLAAILEGVGVLDAKLKEHGGDGHGTNMVTPRGETRSDAPESE